MDLESQLDMMAELCRRGYAGRLVFSHDRHCRSDWFTEEEVESVVPDWHYEYIRDGVLPGLAARGVSAGQVQQMTARDPGDIFAAGWRGAGGAPRHPSPASGAGSGGRGSLPRAVV